MLHQIALSIKKACNIQLLRFLSSIFLITEPQKVTIENWTLNRFQGKNRILANKSKYAGKFFSKIWLFREKPWAQITKTQMVVFWQTFFVQSISISVLLLFYIILGLSPAYLPNEYNLIKSSHLIDVPYRKQFKKIVFKFKPLQSTVKMYLLLACLFFVEQTNFSS